MGSIRIIEDEFTEVDARTIDGRSRLTLGKLAQSKRVLVYVNSRGEILLRPVVEVPASERWLYRNRKALAGVRRGLQDAANGKISRLRTEDL